ncbi:hypothetical protein A0H81_03619 [Grifola frondosa]|uniref:WKF domain-containing protein n=1 Tax=Grifola frondosa TaxID=5627 RepID=A0A1C7MJY1_GRIFR|nr:hypothetical protein A0H81_03619 [Grifola frondosa]
MSLDTQPSGDKPSKRSKTSKDTIDTPHDPHASVLENKSKKSRRSNAIAPETASDTRDDDSSRIKDKNKKAKDKSSHGGADEAQPPAVDVPSSDVKPKKRKRREAEVVADDAEDSKKTKKKRKSVGEGGVEEEETAQEKKRKKKTKEMVAASNVHDEPEDIEQLEEGRDATDEGTPKKRKEKRKHKKDTNDTSAVKKDSSEKEHKKKKRKHSSTDFADPNEDESLSDQARKGAHARLISSPKYVFTLRDTVALYYAYTQFEEPSNWKFNKARQNWLVRNVWSDQAIPEPHIPLVVRYLSNTQGGVREVRALSEYSMPTTHINCCGVHQTLIKTCREVLSPPTPPAPETDQTPSKAAETQPTASQPAASVAVDNNIREQRARTLLAVLTVDTT